MLYIQEPPCAMLYDDHRQPARVGNARYRGFCVDLVAAIGEQTGLVFSLYPTPDGLRGHRQQDGTWTGLVAQILNEVSASVETDVQMLISNEIIVNPGHG